MRGCRWHLALIVHATTANINYDSMGNFYEELEQVFDHFPTLHTKILLGSYKAKFGREYMFKPTNGKYYIVWIHEKLEKKWEYKGTGHQLFIDFQKNQDLFRRKVLNDILIVFGIDMKLVG